MNRSKSPKLLPIVVGALALVVALPAFFVLSFAPVDGLVFRLGVPSSPSWLDAYSRARTRLVHATGLAAPLASYESWWYRTLNAEKTLDLNGTTQTVSGLTSTPASPFPRATPPPP